MVSLNTILAIGGLGAAYLIFKNLGGAAGIGSSIGSGFATFGSSLTKSLNFAPDFQNPLNTGVPTGYRVDPTETRTYEQYIAEYENPLKDEMKTEEESWTPFKFIEGAYGDTTPPNFMDQFTFTDRTPRPTPTPVLTYGPLPPFAGTLEYVVEKEFEGPKLPAYAGTLDYLYGSNV